MFMIAVHAIIVSYTLVAHFDWYFLLFGWAVAKFFNAIGNEVALHRLWCHKSYKTTKFKEMILHFFSTPLLYGSSITYSGIHRQHHAFSDTERDPHITTPWWKVVFYVRNKNYSIEAKLVSDLIKDPVHKWIHRNYFLLNIALLILLLVTLGVELTGYFLSFNVIYNFIAAGLVNVLGHRPEFGTRPFNTKDNSSNNTFLKWLTWNEGYHNNHHHNPGAYSYVMAKGQFDFPGILIEKIFMIKKL
jgi:stearoyl-CoA desaturase (delta-9 desaturase)